MKSKSQILFWKLWLVFLAGGILTGTMTANLLGRELLEQIGCFDAVYQVERSLQMREKYQLWGYVMRQRMIEAGLAGLIGMTLWARGGFWILAFGGGFSMSLMISVFTLERGWLGLPCYLASVMPQGLCYLAVCLILTEGVGEGLDIRKLRVWLLITLLVAAGSGLEAWVNPLILNFL